MDEFLTTLARETARATPIGTFVLAGWYLWLRLWQRRPSEQASQWHVENRDKLRELHAWTNEQRQAMDTILDMLRDIVVHQESVIRALEKIVQINGFHRKPPTRRR